VAPEDYESVRDRVIAALLDWRLPDGEPVVRRALRREDVYTGAFIERAPDVVVELGSPGGYGLSLVPTRWDEAGDSVSELEDHELAGGRGRGMNGTHRLHGIFVSPDIRDPDELPQRLVDVAPWLLARVGIDWQQPHVARARAREEYSPEEDAVVEERLRVMGYIE
jgi:predicted AlkP superfamily phosphohydrolase/phosphomutase